MFKRYITSLLIVCMIVNLSKVTCVRAEENDSRHYSYEKYNVDYIITDIWSGGYSGKITITNTSEDVLENWALLFDYGQNISSIWDANISDSKAGYYIVSNNVYNHDVLSGESVTFGFVSTGQVYYPKNFVYVSSLSSVEYSHYDISYSVTSQVNDEYIINIGISNTSDTIIEDWKLEFEYVSN